MIGTRLGPYEIIEQIGEGGMATVFRAYHPSMDRFVAVKVILDTWKFNDELVARFQREARLIARLEHPYILPVYDFDGTHDPPYIVMRYIDGGTLKDVIHKTILPLEETVYLFQQIGNALDYAHRQGIIHRDLKPQNILFDPFGNALVADFGMARSLTDEKLQDVFNTEVGSVMGTPSYMSPEQVKGEADTDHHQDIYTLGIMLFELVTGELPFAGNNGPQVMVQHLTAPVPDPTELRPDLPIGFKIAIQTAMAKSPQLRYHSVNDMVEAVNDANIKRTSSPAMIQGIVDDARELAKEKSRERSDQINEIIAKFEASRHIDQSAPSQHTIQLTQFQKTLTALALDAAEYSELVEESDGSRAAHQAIKTLWESTREIVETRNGQIFTETDHSLLILWGAIESKEDDAENAVHAALEIKAELIKLGANIFADDDNGDEPLPIRVGINTGKALLTPIDSPDGITISGTVFIDGGLSASGASISIANRLAQRAEGEILITQDTYLSTHGIFELEIEPPFKVRGRREPIPIYRVIGIRERDFKRARPGVEGIQTKLVGRFTEMKHLQNAFEDAIEETETQMATIIGSAGIGKSRLLYEFSEWVDLYPEESTMFQGRATSNMTHRPYSLLREIISSGFEILASDSTEIAMQKMEQGVSTLTEAPNPEMAHMIGHLCGFDFSQSEHLKGIIDDPQQVNQLAKQQLKQLFIQASALNPIVIELEDIHFADDSSLDLLIELVSENDELPLMLVCSARPTLLDHRPDWGRGLEFHIQLQLEPLTKRESRTLVGEILQKISEVPKSLRDTLVEHAEGNPYYMEELVKVLLEDRVLVRQSEQRWIVEESRLTHLRIPSTLDHLLQVRYDTLLYPEKLVLQRASVVGRVFYDNVIEALDKVDESQLTDIPEILDKLVERGFVLRREFSSFEGFTEYNFAQQMMRDSIYDRLLSHQLTTYHAATGDWIVDVAGDRADEFYPLIAENYVLGDQTEKAIYYLQMTGERAFAVSAFAEAQAAFEQALQLIPDERSTERMQMQIHLGEVLNLAGNLNEAASVLEKALQIAQSLDDKDAQANVLYQLGINATSQGNWDLALENLSQALDFAHADENQSTLARVLYGLGDAYFRTGQGEKARQTCQAAILIAEQIGDQYTLMNALNRLGAVEIVNFQNPEEAKLLLNRCLELGQKSGNRDRQMSALNNLGLIAYQKEDWSATISYAQKALVLNRELGNHIGIAITAINLAESHIKLRELEKVHSYLEEGIQAARRAGSTSWLLTIAKSIAYKTFVEGDTQKGLQLFGLAYHHPAASGAIKHAVDNEHMPQLLEEFTENQIQTGMNAGKDLDLDTVINEYLAADN